MLNFAAGFGDPLDAFDLTSALMLAGIEFLVQTMQPSRRGSTSCPPRSNTASPSSRQDH